VIASPNTESRGSLIYLVNDGVRISSNGITDRLAYPPHGVAATVVMTSGRSPPLPGTDIFVEAGVETVCWDRADASCLARVRTNASNKARSVHRVRGLVG
jgi:hypothetical protein